MSQLPAKMNADFEACAKLLAADRRAASKRKRDRRADKRLSSGIAEFLANREKQSSRGSKKQARKSKQRDGGESSAALSDTDEESVTVSSDWRDFQVTMETAPSRKRLTYIQASTIKWEDFAQQISSSFPIGMKVRNVDLDKRALGSNCGACGGDMVPSDGSGEVPLNILSMGGVVQHNWTVIKCGECDLHYGHATDFVRVGLWPISMDLLTSFIDFQFMFFVSTLQHHSPTLSLGSILQTVLFMTSITGENEFHMKQDMFNYSMREWRRQEKRFLLSFTSLDLLQCPACQSQPHCIHIDGNHKLYRYQSAGSVSEQSQDVALFVPRDEVEAKVDEVLRAKLVRENPGNITDTNNDRSTDYMRENVASNCGDTNWKAASAIPGTKRAAKAETGLMIATCRHALVLKTLDMRRGEIYAYDYILQLQFPNAAYIAQDTMCKYWPWLKKIDSDVASTQKPILSVMHAKAHQWSCQMSWSGRVVEGAGLSTGETTELANSYLSRLGGVTRHMTDMGRRERIEEAAVHWNLKKIIGLPKQLALSIAKAEKGQISTKETMEEKAGLAGLTIPEVGQAIDRLRAIGQGCGLLPVERKIEETACTIQRLAYQINRAADSSKQRMKLRGRLQKAHDKLRSLAQSHPTANFESVKDGLVTMVFPWTTSGGGLAITPSLLAAVDSYHLHERTKEELPILIKERNQLWEFLCEKSSSKFCSGILAKCREEFSRGPDSERFYDVSDADEEYDSASSSSDEEAES